MSDLGDRSVTTLHVIGDNSGQGIAIHDLHIQIRDDQMEVVYRLFRIALKKVGQGVNSVFERNDLNLGQSALNILQDVGQTDQIEILVIHHGYIDRSPILLR